jgi:hypothetical protein
MRLSIEQKRRQAVIDLINQMFIIAGHQVTYDDIKDRKDDWYTQWTMSPEQNTEWQDWGVEYLKKNLKMNKKVAETEMAWVSLMWGLKFDRNPYEEQTNEQTNS